MSVIRNTLQPGEALQPGERLQSPNGRYRLELQAHDGNLVLYQQLAYGQDRAVWSTQTNLPDTDANFVRQAVMQEDGNLVLYPSPHARTNPRWASHTDSNAVKGAELRLQNDGNLVMYRDGTARWSTKTWTHAHWMEDLPRALTLQHICMPGSHDAGMYDTKIIWGVGAQGLALTQKLSLYDQLRQGSRYFDLRPRHIEGKGFYVYHGLADGPKLEVILRDVKRFFTEGSQETVILNFSHWQDFGGQDGAFIDLLLHELPANFLFRRREMSAIARERYPTDVLRAMTNDDLNRAIDAFDFATLTLEQLRGKVIVLIDNETMHREVVQKNQQDGIYLQKDHLPVYDSYSNKQDYDDMVRDQTTKFKQYADPRGLFMLNWTLTPLGPEAYDLGDAAWAGGVAGWAVNKATSNLLPLAASTSVDTYAKRINPKLKDATRTETELFGRNPAGRLVNIINLDYLESANAVDVCRDLIAKHNPPKP